MTPKRTWDYRYETETTKRTLLHIGVYSLNNGPKLKCGTPQRHSDTSNTVVRTITSTLGLPSSNTSFLPTFHSLSFLFDLGSPYSTLGYFWETLNTDNNKGDYHTPQDVFGSGNRCLDLCIRTSPSVSLTSLQVLFHLVRTWSRRSTRSMFY